MKPSYFKLAEKLAQKSDHPIHRHGAVIVSGNKILGLGFNKYKTHSRSTHPFKMIHAELSAVISSGLENLTNCDIYIFRRRKDGLLGNSKPCYSCQSMLKSLNIKRVFYSFENGFKKEIY